MKYSLACLLLLPLVLGCRPQKPTQPMQRAECFSFEEPTCSACLLGDDESCQTMIERYQTGEERARDLTRASFFWRQLFPVAQEKCKRDATSCERIGEELWSGALTKRDTITAQGYFAAAEDLYRDKCDKRDISACLSLASLFKQPGYKKPKQEIKIYELMLSFGEGAALSLLRDLWLEYYKSDKLFPIQTTLTQSPEMERLCEAGDLDVCVAVGMFYQQRDLSKALSSLTSSCVSGDGRACLLLAPLLPEEDRPALLRRSCEADLVEGCLAYFAAEASAWQHFAQTWQHRCQQGDKQSCELLSLPNGAQPSPPEAKEKLALLAREDCIHGDGEGCMRWLSSSRGEGTAPLVKPTVRKKLEEGCRDNIPWDCVRLVSFLIPKEKLLARQTMERGCLLGSMEACAQLSSIVWWGEDSIENKEKTRYYGCLAEQLHPFKTTNNCQPN